MQTGAHGSPSVSLNCSLQADEGWFSFLATNTKLPSRTAPKAIGEKRGQSITCVAFNDLSTKDLHCSLLINRDPSLGSGVRFLYLQSDFSLLAAKRDMLWTVAERRFTISPYLCFSERIWLSGKVGACCVRSVCCWHLDAPSQQMASSACSHRLVQRQTSCENTTQCNLMCDIMTCAIFG